MNEVLKALKTRRSIRRFKDDPVPEKAMDAILEAGLYAANGKGLQDPIIIRIADPKWNAQIREENAKIGGYAPGIDPFYGAPEILLVLAHKDWRNRVYDGSLVIGNLMLAAHAQGLGSIWIHRAKEEMESEWGKGLLQALGLDDVYEGIGHCAIGYIDGPVPKAAKRKEGRLYTL